MLNSLVRNPGIFNIDQKQLKRLAVARLFSLIGIGLIFIISKYYLKFSLNFLPIVFVFFCVLVTNLLLFKAKKLNLQYICTAIMYLDTLLLAVIIYFYGGYANPFSMMFIVNVVFSALILSTQATWGIYIFSSLAYVALFYFYIPLPELQSGHAHHHMQSSFNTHLYGMLIVYLMLGVLVTTFVLALKKAFLAERAETLKLRVDNERQARQLGLSNLAAGAAHELATPLATMSVIISDLHRRTLDANYEATPEDISILKQQILRCEDILAQMRAYSKDAKLENYEVISIKQLRDNLLNVFSSDTDRLLFKFEDTILHIPKLSMQKTLENLINNALEHSDELVIVNLKLEYGALNVEISDSGSGIAPEILSQVGEPFFTAKESNGLGLGVYLAKSFIERMNGSFRIESEVSKGTKVIFSFPHEHYDRLSLQ